MPYNRGTKIRSKCNKWDEDTGLSVPYRLNPGRLVTQGREQSSQGRPTEIWRACLLLLPSQGSEKAAAANTDLGEENTLDEYPQIALNVCIIRVHRRNKKYSINNYTISSKACSFLLLWSVKTFVVSLSTLAHNISSHVHLFSGCKNCWSERKRFPNIHISQVKSVQTARSMRSK